MYIKYIIYNYFSLKYGKLRQLAINCDNTLRRVSSPENMKGLITMYFNTNDKYITPEEVADELGLSLTTVYNLLRKGQLLGVKVGRKWLILREKIERIC